MRVKYKRLVFIFSIMIILLLNLSITTYAIEPVQGYANGNEITISENGYNWPNLSNIYGGTSGDTIDSTNITIGKTSSVFTNTYGGSKVGDINGNSQITYNANNVDVTSAAEGYTSYHLYGGNKDGGTIKNTIVNINSGWIRGWTVGGSMAGTITGDSTVNVTGGFIGSAVNGFSSGQGEVYGGPGGTGVLEGNTYVNISGNKFVSEKYQEGDNVTIIRQHVIGGPFTGGTVKGNTNVNITGGTVLGQVLGGGGGGRCC